MRAVGYSTFTGLWRSLLPSVILMKPKTDLCWQCQKGSTVIQRSANLSEEEKSAAVLSAQEHLRIVCKWNDHFTRLPVKSAPGRSRRTFRPLLLSLPLLLPVTFLPTLTPSKSTIALTMHSRFIQIIQKSICWYMYDFIFAKINSTLFISQVHFPSDPMQPGPIYFLIPRKCSVFGVHCEAIPRQINFITEKSGEVGKGANAVISRLHYFFDVHGLGETDVYQHADNCTGQNKNNAMINFLMWRVMTGRHTNITYSFLIVRHTKFSLDWCFGLFKRLFKRTKVDCMADIATVVDSSVVCNVSQLVHTEDTEIVPT